MPKSKRRPQQQRKAQNTQTAVSPESGAIQPTAPRATSATAATRVAAQTLTGAARHPYIADELKRIGILTAIMLVLLVVLAFALPHFI
jgi:hypothetical protein